MHWLVRAEHKEPQRLQPQQSPEPQWVLWADKVFLGCIDLYKSARPGSDEICGQIKHLVFVHLTCSHKHRLPLLEIPYNCKLRFICVITWMISLYPYPRGQFPECRHKTIWRGCFAFYFLSITIVLRGLSIALSQRKGSINTRWRITCVHKKWHKARYGKYDKSAEINILWNLSGDFFNFLWEGKALWRNKRHPSQCLGVVFPPKIQSKENIWATDQPMKNHTFEEQLFIWEMAHNIKLINRIQNSMHSPPTHTYTRKPWKEIVRMLITVIAELWDYWWSLFSSLYSIAVSKGFYNKDLHNEWGKYSGF